MKQIIPHFGQSQSQQELINDLEEIKTRGVYMMGFGLLLAFSTLVLIIRNRG